MDSKPQLHTVKPRRWTRWLRNLAIGLGLLLAMGALYEPWGQVRDAKAYPAPGQLVDVGGYRLHIACTGQGSPTVILENGSMGTSPTWALGQPQVAAFARVCVYDRAGYAWSDPATTPRTGAQVVADLDALLQKAGVPGPYVVVGHSLGGMYSRLYAGTHPDRVVGLVLVDPRPEEFTREMEAIGRKADASGAIGLLYPVLQRTGLLRGFAHLGGARVIAGTGVDNMTEQDRGALVALTLRPALLKAAMNEGEQLPELETALRNVGALGEMPLVVLSHSVPFPFMSGKPEEIWQRLQAQTAGLSTRGRLEAVSGAGHNVMVDRPDAVVQAIRDVVEAARTH